jgi:DNA primase
MKTHWIDFKALRAQLDFSKVLEHYGVKVKRTGNGNQHHGFCPLPNHSGKRNSPSFSANLEKGIFQCFGCGAKGNVLDFAGLMEKTDPKDGTQLRKIALKLQEQLCPELANGSPERSKAPSKTEPKPELPVIVNAPLDFELKGLDANHPYLLGRKFTPEVINQFGLGFCSRGYLKNRVAIPLHDEKGQLVGYAGRVIDDDTVTEDNPRYRLPGTRERAGKMFEFRKTLFLYNGFRIQKPVDDLIVVEGFTGVWWLVQNELSNAVATMGADCSEKQAEFIVSLLKPGGTVWIMPDGNAAGERCALAVLRLVSPHRAVRWVKLTDERQPTGLSKEELKMRFIA